MIFLKSILNIYFIFLFLLLKYNNLQNKLEFHFYLLMQNNLNMKLCEFFVIGLY